MSSSAVGLEPSPRQNTSQHPTPNCNVSCFLLQAILYSVNALLGVSPMTFGLFILLLYSPPETGQASCCWCFNVVSLVPCRRVCWVRYPNWIRVCVSYSPDLQGLSCPAGGGSFQLSLHAVGCSWPEAQRGLSCFGAVCTLSVAPGSGNTVRTSLGRFFRSNFGSKEFMSSGSA